MRRIGRVAADDLRCSGTATSTSCPFDDNGSFTVKGRIFDKDDGFTTYQATVVVNNVAPTATFRRPAPSTRAAQHAIVDQSIGSEQR